VSEIYVRTSMGKPKVDGRNGTHELDPFSRPAHTITTKSGEWRVYGPRPETVIRPAERATKGEPMDVSALDLFAGAGGWSVACDRIGIDETGVEIMPEAVATRAAAGFKTHEVGDVWEFDFTAARGEFDGLIASPPCQTFSTAGKGAGRKALDDVIGLIRSGTFKSIESLRAAGLGDERTALVLTPLHAAWEMRPEWIAWEQVPTVLPVWEACADELRSWGYSVWTGNLQAEMYGVPQTRKRAFLLAHKDREVTAPVPTHSRYYPRSPEKLDAGVQKWVSMAEALGWALTNRPSPTITGGGTETGGAEPIAKIQERYVGAEGWVYRSTTMPNSAQRPAPAPTVAFGHDAASVKWFHNRPSTTVVGSFKPEIIAAPGYRTTVSRQNAEGSVRVTVQEAGILQSFPADFPWQGAKGKQYLQCGNAVPPLLAEAVLRAVV
jgi:DNA (cytosine-5)-methyltransferase 1